MKLIIALFALLAFSTPNLFVDALTIAPARIEITVDPGEEYIGEIELFNEEAEGKTFYTSFENFEPRGDTGAPYFVGAKDGLATWLSTDPSVVLGSGERIFVPFSVRVPENTEPGGYFAAVFFATTPPEETGAGTVSIGGKIGVLVLLRVAGDIEEGGGILSFSPEENKRFFSALPVVFEYRMNNTGGDRVVPLGEITIRNTFWMKSATLLANENRGSVLPGSARKFSATWGNESAAEGFFATAKRQWKDLAFGVYRASLDVTWGESAQTAHKVFYLFVIPWQLLLIVIPLLTIGFFGGRFLIRRYNKHIIAQARGAHTE
jgi:hypothetical protein